MNNIVVSIIMPVKNAACWVSDTVNSINDQSFTQWELIAIDDHSADDSRMKLEKFASMDSRIRVVPNIGIGIIPALQLGLSLANGEFITRMDADDIMPKDRLEIMVYGLINSPPKTVITGKVQYFPTPISEGYLKYQAWINDRVSNKDHFDHIFRECVIASPNWIVRTEEIRSLGKWEELIYPEDYDMVFKWYENGFKVEGLKEITLLWREHPQRTSRNSEIYDQPAFFELKLHWFRKLNLHKGENLALFGAGQKGKIVANYFLQHSISFTWYDQNYERYNTPVLGQKILDPNEAKEKVAVLCINPELLTTLTPFLANKQYVIGENAWFF